VKILGSFLVVYCRPGGSLPPGLVAVVSSSWLLEKLPFFVVSVSQPRDGSSACSQTIVPCTFSQPSGSGGAALATGATPNTTPLLMAATTNFRRIDIA
jgi:hypothetical protein